jgi:diguanylate cyclase (GGDEF)-like protein/PAS domain S-box-containing protein/putative nucleotidyltransferase with HDIG domain
MTAEEVQLALHELQVYQIELEMQNDELQRTQEELDAIRLKYLDLYEFAPLGYCILSLEGMILEANLTAATLLGVARSDLKRRQFTRFILPEDQDVFYLFRKKLVETAEPQTCELRLKMAEGMVIQAHLDAATTLDATGKMVYRLVFNDSKSRGTNREQQLDPEMDKRDAELLAFTERQHSAQVLKESEERLHLALRACGMGTWQLDIENSKRFFDDQTCRLLGLDSAVFLGTSEEFYGVLHKEDIDGVKAKLQTTLDKGVPYESDYRVVWPDGSVHWLTARGEITRNSRSLHPTLNGVVWDITEHKQAELLLQKYKAMLDQVQKLGQVGGWEFDIDTGIQTWTEEVYAVHEVELDFNPNVEKGIDFYTPESRPLVERALKNAMENGSPLDLELEIITAKGNLRNVHAIGRADLQHRKIYGFFQDITERKQMEMRTEEANTNLKTIFEASPIGMLILDSDTNIVMANAAVIQICGGSGSDIIGNRPGNALGCVNSTMDPLGCGHSPTCLLCPLRNSIEALLKSGDSMRGTELEFVLVRSGESRRVCFGVGAEPISMSGRRCMCVSMEDITERKKAEEQILRISYHDEMTGLYNRRFYEEELRRLDTPRNLPLSFVIGDVNGLKLINDSFGHLKGDELLRTVANVLKSECRADDILVRLSGDEFAVLLPKSGSAEAENLMNRFRKRLAQAHTGLLEVSVAFGSATKEVAEEPFSIAFKIAEDSMYRNKVYESHSIQNRTISLIMTSLLENNPREQQHSNRVSELCVDLAREMGQSDAETSRIRLAGLMHDIGKIGLRESVLNKQGILTQIERNEMEKHPEIGYRILNSVSDFSEISECVLQHHERWDGAGYPNGLKGLQIQLSARMIAVADTYDAMTSERTYRETLNSKDAIDELNQCSGTQFDPEIVRSFIEMLRKQPTI